MVIGSSVSVPTLRKDMNTGHPARSAQGFIFVTSAKCLIECNVKSTRVHWKATADASEQNGEIERADIMIKTSRRNTH